MVGGRYPAAGGRNHLSNVTTHLHPPPRAQTALPRVARDRGYEAVEKTITTGELLAADEAFLCGTGGEVTPVNRVDDTVIGDGGRGPITEKIQQAYVDVVHGEIEEYSHWLTYL